MAKAAKPKAPSSLKAMLRARATLHSLAALLVILAAAAGLYSLRRHVDRRILFPANPPVVALKNVPPWMSPFLMQQIANLAKPNGTHSAFDHQLLVDTYASLRTSPWIRSIRQVRRLYNKGPADTIEVDCEYRAPVALVHWGDYYWLVDNDGVKLPDAFTSQQVPQIVAGRDGKLNIRIVEGIKHAPPEPGSHWIGEDLAAGLDMVKLLFDQPFAQEIVKVDISNFAGRKDNREAQIVLVTRHNTEIRWGRPVNSNDYFVEVPPARKLQYLAAILQQTGRIDGRHPWIDIRFDQVIYPTGEAAQANYHN